MHHMVANALYDNPFSSILGMGIPMAGTIFYSQMKHHNLSFSQKVMATRVYAQGAILVMAMSCMGFREFMNRRGRFPEYDDDGKIVDEDEYDKY